MTGIVALAWAAAAVAACFALALGCERGHRVPGPSWFDLPRIARPRAKGVPERWYQEALSEHSSKKASERAQQTPAHRRRKTRR